MRLDPENCPPAGLASATGTANSHSAPEHRGFAATGRLILQGATPTVRVCWGALAAVAAAAAATGQWADLVVALLCVALTLLPLSLPALSGLVLPPRAVDALFLFFVATLGLGEIFDFYLRVRPWDWAMHFTASTGFALAGAVAVVAATGGRTAAPSAGALLAAGVSVACGTVWELFEFSLDVAFGLDTQKGFANTMLDMVANILGAALGGVWVRQWLAGRPESGPTRVLGDFLRANPRLCPRGAAGVPGDVQKGHVPQKGQVPQKVR